MEDENQVCGEKDVEGGSCRSKTKPALTILSTNLLPCLTKNKATTTIESNKGKKQKTSGVSTDSHLIYLPDEILLFHILARLPVKSVRRFTCVSKLWYATLGGEDPEFVSSHILHSEQKNPTILALFYVDEEPLVCRPRSDYFNFISLDPTFKRFSSYHCFRDVKPSLKSYIVGYCNGLFCSRSWYGKKIGFEITNLSTREVLLLPEPQPQPMPRPRRFIRRVRIVKYGFGFDSLKNEYKIVQLVDARRCLVLTFGVGTTWAWREIPIPSELKFLNDYHHPTPSLTTYSSNPDIALFSGRVFYWFFTEDNAMYLLCLDIHTEEFLLIPAPPGPEGTRHYYFTLFNGLLCCGYQKAVRCEVMYVDVHLFWLLNDPFSPNHVWEEEDTVVPNILGPGTIVRLTSFQDHFIFYFYDKFQTLMFFHTNTMSCSFVGLSPTFDAFPSGMRFDLLPEPIIIYHKENIISMKTFLPPGADIDQVICIRHNMIT